MQVASYMTRGPITIGATDTLQTASDKMRAGSFRRLPVVDNDVLTGILTDRDLRAHTGHLEETRVTAAMTENPLTVAPKTTMREAAQQMLRHKLDSLPVIENGRLVGIVTTTDILKAFVEGSVNAVRT